MSQTGKYQIYQELVTRCDQLIKVGDLSSVASLISRLSFTQIPRPFRQSLAKICRRAGLINQGLKILQPIVRQEKENLDPATSGEICEYSVLLSRNGSNLEALKLLEKISGQENPEALLYLAFCHITNWDYYKAVPLLEMFLNSGADDYSKLIGRVNLGSAYLSTDQLDRAELHLKETIEIAEKTGASRLAGNCLELLGHVHFQKNDIPESKKILDQALAIFQHNQSYDPFMIYKTQAIIKALQEKSSAPLVTFRRNAVQKKYWEMVREIDMYLGKINFDQKRFDHLIYGTPMIGFRNWIQKELSAKPSPNYLFGKAASLRLDLRSGKIDGADFAAGKKIHQTIAALVQDFYKPRNIGTLFSVLYPNEFFDINSSQHRVEQLLWRTRKWLVQNQIPASIELIDGAYQFQIKGSFGILLSLQESSIDVNTTKWLHLKAHFPPGTSFTAQQACLKLGWPRSTFLSIAQWGLQQGELQKSGAAKATVYQIQMNQQATRKTA